MEEYLNEFFRSDGGLALVTFIETYKTRQEQIIQVEALTRPIDEIRRTAGRIEGMDFIINAIKEARKVTK